jgi:HK97 gp10 family phage protein
MANSSGIQFEGIEELGEVLAGLPGRFGDQVVDKILRKAAQPMLRRAKELSSNADVTGDTTKSIGIIANRKNNSIKLGPRRGNGFKGYHAHLLEYGTAPHIIKAKAADGLLVWAGGAAREVQHPGIAAQPFMRPAFDAEYRNSIESIKTQCAAIIADGFKSVFK